MRAIVVCPLLPHPPVTGGQKRTLRLVEALERAGGHPHLLTAHEDHDAAAALRARGWEVDVIPEPPPTTRARVEQHLRRRPSPLLTGVGRRVATLGPGSALLQLEHTQSAYYGRFDVPSVLSLHNLDSQLRARTARTRTPGTPAWLRDWNRALATRSTERRNFPRAAFVICVSEADAAAARKGGAEVVVAPNGVDDELFAVPPAGAARRAVFFGHFGYEPNRRGLQRFLEAGWPEVRRAAPDATLTVAGVGAQGEGPGVEVLGVVEDMAGLLASARAVVVPVWEGGGTRLKVLEAMAAGRPVAGTAVGVEGIGFEHGRHGLIADAPDALGRALARVLEDDGGMGAAGREHARGFRWETTLAELEKRYRLLLDERRNREGAAKD